MLHDVCMLKTQLLLRLYPISDAEPRNIPRTIYTITTALTYDQVIVRTPKYPTENGHKSKTIYQRQTHYFRKDI